MSGSAGNPTAGSANRGRANRGSVDRGSVTVRVQPSFAVVPGLATVTVIR